MTSKSRLHIPHPSARPGEAPDFSYLSLSEAGALERPDSDSPASKIEYLAHKLVRVMGDDGVAYGEWNPDLTKEQKLEAMRLMLLTRQYDDRMQRVQRQGKISFYMQSLGEEAISIGQGMALESGDMLFPSYRNQGLFILRDTSLVDMMCQCLSNTRDMCKGRQMPIMYHNKAANLFSVSGNLATQYPQAVGWAMASAIKGEDHISASWVGDGSTAEADFHYALTFAAVYQAPVILNVANNQWAISTFQGFAGGERRSFAARGLGLGIPGIRVDGNDLLAVYAVTQWAAKRARQGGGPTLIEHVTYRGGAHSTSDDPTRYRPKDEWSEFPLGDPVERLKQHMIRTGYWSDEQHEALIDEQKEIVVNAWKEAVKYGTMTEGPSLDVSGMFDDVYEELPENLKRQRQQLMDLKEGQIMSQMNMIQAINSALDAVMEKDPSVIILGQDVGYFGGVFRVTDGLQAKYGEHRVIDAPIAEGGIIGSAIGIGVNGLRPVAEIQFADYIYPGLDQIISELARLRYRSGGEFFSPVTVRAPCGGGIRGGQTHSQSPEALFTHLSGIKTVMPSSPYDAKGLLISAIESNDPVVFFEPKRIYNGPFDGDPNKPSVPWSKHPAGEVPEGHYTIPLGKAAVIEEGSELSIITYGTMVHVAQAAVRQAGVSADIIDVRTLAPLDTDTLKQSVEKTGRCLIAHEASKFCGYGAELVATVQEECFWHLQAPIVRVAGWETPYPHAFEWDYFPGQDRIIAGIREIMEAV